MLGIIFRNARRLLKSLGELRIHRLLELLDPLLDLANRHEVLVELAGVRSAELALQPLRILVDKVKNALTRLFTTRRGLGAFLWIAAGEEALEDELRIDFL